MSNAIMKLMLSGDGGDSKKPLTFTAEKTGSTITLNKTGSPIVDGLQYRLGNSGKWKTYTIGEIITLENIGDQVQFQNKNEGLSTSGSNYVKFVMTGQIAGSGNIQSMLNYIENAPNYCFYYLFYYCSVLTTAPELPAITIGQNSYGHMFYNCSNLTTAPEVLPAISVGYMGCYNMFAFCSKLTTAPELPATNLDEYCYDSMFYYCSKLTTAPELPATKLAEDCYDSMFYGCSKLTTAPELPATELVKRVL